MPRILIIKLGALGDLMIASTAIRQLINQHANDQVSLLTSNAFLSLFESWEGLSVLPFKRGPWRQQLQLGFELRRQRYQRVYDLQGSDRSRALCWLTGASERVGLWPGWPYTIYPSLARKQKQPPYQRIDAMLSASGCTATVTPQPMTVSAADHAQVEIWLKQQSINKPLVLLHAGCSPRWSSKRWPEASFIELGEYLSDAGMQIIWLGGPDEQALNRRLSAHNGINACGIFSIAGLIALAQQARFAITNDSGPMHVAAAFNVPMVAIFGPTDHTTTSPWGTRSQIVRHAVECSPCMLRQCPIDHRCMQRITVEDVLSAAAALLEDET